MRQHASKGGTTLLTTSCTPSEFKKCVKLMYSRSSLTCEKGISQNQGNR